MSEELNEQRLREYLDRDLDTPDQPDFTPSYETSELFDEQTRFFITFADEKKRVAYYDISLETTGDGIIITPDWNINHFIAFCIEYPDFIMQMYTTKHDIYKFLDSKNFKHES